MRIMLATNNPSKVARVKKQLAGRDVEILTPKDLGITPIETEEGSDIAENALMKAQAYFGNVDMPILGLDTAFVIAGEDLDPAKVRRNAIRDALGDRDEATMTQEEICDVMISFYQNVARRHGGTVDAYFDDVFALVFPDGTVKTERDQRLLALTDEVHGDVDAHFPIRSLYLVKATGKRVAEQSEDEEALELAPYRAALERILGLSDE